MDPNTTLETMRETYKLLNQVLDSDQVMIDVEMLAGLAQSLADSAESIDGWLSSGGFLPKAWER